MKSPYVKLIPCPAHPTGRARWWDPRRHQAILFCTGSKWEGIWECPVTGESDSHEHGDYEIETVESWPTSPVDTPYESRIYICGGENGCGMMIEDEDPDVDRAEALADMEIMEARGK